MQKPPGERYTRRGDQPCRNTPRSLFSAPPSRSLLAGCASQGPIVTAAADGDRQLVRIDLVFADPGEVRGKDPHSQQRGEDIEVQRVDYAVDLFDTQLFTDSEKGIRRTRPTGDQNVTFSFQVAMDDIANQGIDLLSEQDLRVTFRGDVFTAARYGMDPVPFTATVTVPIPRMPEVSYVGSEGEPLSDTWRLNFSVVNTNHFPFTLSSVKTFLILNGKKYLLLHTHGEVELKPGETTPVTLQMENTPGKALGMALNLATNRALRFNVTGMVTCKTEYGWIFIPLDLEEPLQ